MFNQSGEGGGGREKDVTGDSGGWTRADVWCFVRKGIKVNCGCLSAMLVAAKALG